MSSLDAQEVTNNFARGNVEFEHIWEEDGLNKFITSIYLDSRGFLWFGSYMNGLYKYNGYSFENFNFKYNDSISLAANHINKIFLEDSLGDIWLTTGNGQLHRYKRATNNIIRISCNTADSNSLFSGKIMSVVEDHQRNIWIGSLGTRIHNTTGGLLMFERSSGRFIHYNIRTEKEDPLFRGVECLFVDSSGMLWAGTVDGAVIRVDTRSEDVAGMFTYYRLESDNSVDSLNFAVQNIIEDRFGSVWFGTNGGGVLRYEKSKDKIRRYRLSPDKISEKNIISQLFVDSVGELWLGTGDGLAGYDRGNDTFVLYVHDPKDPYSITSGRVIAIAQGIDGSLWTIINNSWYTKGINRFDPATGKFFLYHNNPHVLTSLSTNLLITLLVDKTGILWIGTFNEGIEKFDPQKRKFGLYSCTPDNPTNMPGGRIYTVFEDHKGVFWIGTHAYGLFRFDRKTGGISRYMNNTNDPQSINKNTILTICEEPPGILWLGGLGGLKRLDTETMEFRHFVHNQDDPNSVSGNHIMSLLMDRSGILWICTLHSGIDRFDPKIGKFEPLGKFWDNQRELGTTQLYLLYEDSKGTIWIGSDKGLIKYIPDADKNYGKFQQYTHDDKNPNSISSNVVRSIMEDNTGTLWIGTDGGGLNKFNVKKETFTIYTMENGLPSNTIWGILVDGKSNLWLSTNNGLSKLNPETEEFFNYDISDGLQGLEFNFNAYYKSRSGEMFFGGGKGINYFYPDSVKKNLYVPPIVITDFKLYNKSVSIKEGSLLPKSISELKKLELKYNENFISFEFAALNYTNSHKNRYKYRMIGLDPDTIFAGTKRLAEYTELKPGKYTFWVTGSNNDGVWNSEGVSLDIVVYPPWWGSKLAYGIYLLLLFSFIVLFINWRTRKLRKDKEELEKQVKERTSDIEERDFHIIEMDRMKTRFFANISHEFRTPLTLILSPLEELLLKNRNRDGDFNKLTSIRRNGLRLLDLVNQLLDLSKLDSGKLKLELTEADIINALRLSFSTFISLADKKSIQYTFSLPERTLVTCFDRGKLETIMNNLLSNAFKYTPINGKIECTVVISNNSGGSVKQTLEIFVVDSGPGIKEDKLNLIFNRFYQVDELHHIEGGGSGIGLSLTKELVNLIHGEIKVKSKPGEGSCFTVTIPTGTAHLKESEYVIIKPEQQMTPILTDNVISEEEENDIQDSIYIPSKRENKILIVEDNTELRTYLKEQFQKIYFVEEAVDGEEGFQKSIKSIPDLIITDLMMPVMGGVELCRKVKTDENTSHIPVIMLTAKADMASRIEGLEIGADDYIVKPFHFHELKTRVLNLIEQRQKLRKMFSCNLDMLPEDIAFNSYDLKFINRIIAIVEDNLADFDFDVDSFHQKSGMSHPQLYRKLTALTGLSPSKFIRTMRLKRAKTLMTQKKEKVTDIAYSVGFNNLSYFIKCFKEQYGVSPSGFYKTADT
jgi:signal transduction histidine kinase/ligand-binding sensor domain-containing protein/AraC-like DNA-binding protein